MITATEAGLEWYCLRAQTKREPMAASMLRAQLGIEVYLPRLKHRKKTVRGPVWFTEALFPGYLFARINLKEHLRIVSTISGVAGVVHFNQQYFPLEDAKIEELQSIATVDEIVVIEETVKPGGAVEVISGSFAGIRGLVSQYRPAKDRVTILLNFLGRETEVEMPVTHVLPDSPHPLVTA